MSSRIGNFVRNMISPPQPGASSASASQRTEGTSNQDPNAKLQQQSSAVDVDIAVASLDGLHPTQRADVPSQDPSASRSAAEYTTSAGASTSLIAVIRDQHRASPRPRPVSASPRDVIMASDSHDIAGPSASFMQHSTSDGRGITTDDHFIDETNEHSAQCQHHGHNHGHGHHQHQHHQHQNQQQQQQNPEQLSHQASLESILSTTSSQLSALRDAPQEERDRLKEAHKAQCEMRKAIVVIQADKTLSDAEKAKKIQELMSRSWQKKQQVETRDTHVINKLENKRSDFGLVTEEDKLPTYHDKASGILGCKHYQRAAKLQAHCCGRWDTCRFCHDEVSDHNIIRNRINTMMCMYCSHVQPAAQDCTNCGARVAKYYCKECKLWDSDPRKNIYHCDDCGICRIGKGLGIDYFHCKKCNVCMAISLKGRHKCIERNLESDCPICGEYMFTSTTTVIFMPCGHCIHYKCHQEYIQTSYQCPTCLKSLADMSDYFRRIDEALQQQAMPPDFADTYNQVYCNDCEVKTYAKFHFMYHKCQKCKGYNTKVVQTIAKDQVPDEAMKIIEEDLALSQRLYGNSASVAQDDEMQQDDNEQQSHNHDHQQHDGHQHQQQQQQHQNQGPNRSGSLESVLSEESIAETSQTNFSSIRRDRTMSAEELNEDIERARRRSLVNGTREQSRRGSIVTRGQDQWWCHQCEAATIPNAADHGGVICNFCGSDFLEQI